MRVGACVPACPHDAIDVVGDVAGVRRLAASGDAVLILSVETAVWFYPVAPEQVVNAAYELGFRAVHHGVLGDELVAEEYRRLMDDPGWGTMIRSTCPVLVEKVRREYPELVPYLAPVKTPLEAEAAYLREVYGPDTPLVYVGVCMAEAARTVDAAVTHEELARLFDAAGVVPEEQPRHFTRIPGERRRHLSTSGGMPLQVLLEQRQASQRFRKFRGLQHLDRLARAVAVDRIDLGFVDILPCEGCLDHPLMGPPNELFWRRRVAEQTEPPRSPLPVVDPEVRVKVARSFTFHRNGDRPPAEEVDAVVRQIGTAPNGLPWNCGACGYATCAKFAVAYLRERATFHQCPPYQWRRTEEAQREAAVDALTGLATYRVLRDRLVQEAARSKRSHEPFSVLFLDMDDFKQINDSRGHQAGSAVLAAVGQQLQAAIRGTDIAARYGGDEFVVVLIRTDLQGARRVAEALRERVTAVGRALGYPSGAVTASIGVAEYDPAAANPLDVLEAADRSLYRAKGAGGDTVA